MNPLGLTCELDHLVVVAHTLAQGARWCEQLLGVAPVPGGRHAFMGTHNSLLAIGAAAFPKAYLEIIAIDPDAPAPPRPRWFGMDQAAQRERVAQAPQWVHLVVRTPDVASHTAALRALGADPGPVVAAQRATPHGLLRWRLSIRDDGQLPHHGALPTCIEWQSGHPSADLPRSGVELQTLALSGLPASVHAALALQHVEIAPAGHAALQAQWATPLGRITLQGGWP